MKFELNYYVFVVASVSSSICVQLYLYRDMIPFLILIPFAVLQDHVLY